MVHPASRRIKMSDQTQVHYLALPCRAGNRNWDEMCLARPGQGADAPCRGPSDLVPNEAPRSGTTYCRARLVIWRGTRELDKNGVLATNQKRTSNKEVPAEWRRGAKARLCNVDGVGVDHRLQMPALQEHWHDCRVAGSTVSSLAGSHTGLCLSSGRGGGGGWLGELSSVVAVARKPANERNLTCQSLKVDPNLTLLQGADLPARALQHGKSVCRSRSARARHAAMVVALVCGSVA